MDGPTPAFVCNIVGNSAILESEVTLLDKKSTASTSSRRDILGKGGAGKDVDALRKTHVGSLVVSLGLHINWGVA
jgi:hypothetical protein